ncbi:MAG TPA: 50S ribosomal protein L11 methyltransferase [Candidatus Saccharimonadales bacterium]|nr:50S ribosomal protein L11 methyltransferase [Candidatus Saccharimonadales bacterium]
MPESPSIIWSNTDYPYICLLDKKRTSAFQSAINEIVNPGDTVLEVGAGTGILSLFAANAGATKVIAVEIDPVLEKNLHETVKANKFEDIIQIIKGNALTADLPKNVDVVIGELIETGLLDEMQVEVINSLHNRSVIGPNTKVLPSSYETYVQLVHAESTFYGFHIASPKHDWPYYNEDPKNWAPLKITPASDIQKIGKYDFQAGPVKNEVEIILDFSIPRGETANAIRLSGVAILTPEIRLGPTNSFNGDKILNLGEALEGNVKLKISYTMGAGLDNFKFENI